jgi:hypothetical protein
MPVCPTLRFSFLGWGKGSSLSQPQVALLQVAPPQAALHLNLASMRRLEIVGDHLEGLIDWPYRKRA